MQAGDKVRFKPGREGTFAQGTELEVVGVMGPLTVVQVGRGEWPVLTERLDAVDE